MNVGKLFNLMIFQILICNKRIIRCCFSVCLDDAFFRSSLDSAYSYPSSSGYTTVAYVSWQSIVTGDVPISFVLNHCFQLRCMDNEVVAANLTVCSAT